MAERDGAARADRVTARSRGPAIALVILFAGGASLALLKPWSAAAPSIDRDRGAASSARAAGTSLRSAVPGSLLPAPTESAALKRRQCRDPDVWRLVTFERSGALQGLSLVPVTLVSATGPTDPTIVPQTVRAEALLALGYCVPTSLYPDVRGTEARVAVWQLVEGRQPIRIDGTGALDQPLARAGEVYLWPPAALTASPRAPGAPPGDPAWPDGRYIFKTPGADDAASGWFAFDYVSNRPVMP